ncbi:MAG: PD-(D/E)XK nuclease family protein [Lentimicrobiaceae bacterium]|jgi:hypothetical protein|nr:PD-(D/E)XK nuclease family protein [Lentimicrobiaceae bacterium]
MYQKFIDKIADFILENYDSVLEQTTIVFPNKRAALFLRYALSIRIEKNIWLPEILSIEEAICKWTGLQIADNIQMLFELIEIEHERKGNDKNDLTTFSGLAIQMANDFDEIDHYLCDSEKLFAYLHEAKAVELWHADGSELTVSERAFIQFYQSLIHYYNDLRKRLLDKNLAYRGLITRTLAEMDDEQLLQKTKSRKIVFAGFNALTLAEEKLFEKLHRIGTAVVLWDFDTYYLNKNEFPEHEAGLFARKIIKKNTLKETFFIDNQLETSKKKIHITAVPGNAIQAKAMAANLVKEKNSTIETAIVLADENLLIPTLNSIPESVEAFNVTMGYPFDKSSIFLFLNMLFETQLSQNKQLESNSFYLWEILKIISHEICNTIFESTDIQILNKWKTQLIFDKKRFVKKEDFAYLNDKSKHLNDFIQLTLKRWKSTSEALETIEKLIAQIAKMLAEKEGKTYIFLLNQLSIADRIINRLKLLFEESNIALDIKNLKNIFEQIARQSSIKLYGEPILGLQIMGLLESRNLDFETIHMMSVNEKIIPKEKSYQSLIPYDIRITHQMPTYKQKQAVYAYHFFRLLQSAKQIFLYYNTETANSGSGEPSRFILEIKHELTKINPNIEIEETLFATPMSEKDIQKPIVIEKTETILMQIIQKAKRGFSPSLLSTYNTCPLKFYLQFVLNIKDDSLTEKIQQNVLGTIVHESISHLYKEYKTLDFEIIAKCRTQLAKVLEEVFIAVSGSEKTTSGYNFLIYEVARKTIEQILDLDEKLLKEGNTIEIISLEEGIQTNYTYNNESFVIKGFIDRIDKLNGVYRIIDYKTGKVNKKDLELKEEGNLYDPKYEKALQLLCYEYLFKKEKINGTAIQIESGIINTRQISSGLIKLNTEKLNAESNEILFEDFLKKTFHEIFETMQPFVQTDDETRCKHCDFAVICDRKSD